MPGTGYFYNPVNLKKKFKIQFAKYKYKKSNFKYTHFDCEI